MFDSALVKVPFCFLSARGSAPLGKCGKTRSTGTEQDCREQSNFSSLLVMTYPKWQSVGLVDALTGQGTLTQPDLFLQGLLHSRDKLCNSLQAITTNEFE